MQAIKNVYDNSGRLTSTTDANGKTINYTHALAANQEAVQNRLGQTTIYTYDNDGNIVQTQDPLGNTTSATYDADDNKLTSTDALGKTTTYTYDAMGDQLDANRSAGQQDDVHVQLVQAGADDYHALNRTSTNVYDGSANLLSMTDAMGKVTSYTYSNGLVQTLTDALNNQTTFGYDGKGNLTSQTEALGNVSKYSYDGNNNKLSQAVTRTLANGTKQTLTTKYQYDSNNRLTQTTMPDGTYTQTQYNSIGKQVGDVRRLAAPDQLRLRQRRETAEHDVSGRYVSFDNVRCGRASVDFHGSRRARDEVHLRQRWAADEDDVCRRQLYPNGLRSGRADHLLDGRERERDPVRV